MSKNEKIGIVIVVILLIILAISIWAGSGKSEPTSAETKTFCQNVCHKTSDSEWEFEGQKFSSQEECSTKCQATVKR